MRISVGASVLIDPGGSFEDFQQKYSTIRFDATDILYVSPFDVRADKTFGFSTDKLDQYKRRFEWLVTRARIINPCLQIILMQMWSTGKTIDVLNTDKDIAIYADSVAAFISKYKDQSIQDPYGNRISLRLNGYDNDYEAGNVCENAPKVFAAIRARFDAIDITQRLHLSIAPSEIEYLDDPSILGSLSHVNMQNYSGGRNVRPSEYQHLFAKSNVKLVYGVSSEVSSDNFTEIAKSTNIIDTIYQIVKQGNYAGIYVWRLDSGNTIYQNAFQVHLYNRFHDTNLRCEYTLQQVVDNWSRVAGQSFPPFDLLHQRLWQSSG